MTPLNRQTVDDKAMADERDAALQPMAHPTGCRGVESSPLEDFVEEARAARGWQNRNKQVGMQEIAEAAELIFEMRPQVVGSEAASGTSTVAGRKPSTLERIASEPVIDVIGGLISGEGAARLAAIMVGTIDNLANPVDPSVLGSVTGRGLNAVGIRDATVREALNLAELQAKYPECGVSNEGVDILSVTEGGKFTITEVKETLGRAGADIDKALSQLINIVQAPKPSGPDARIG